MGLVVGLAVAAGLVLGAVADARAGPRLAIAPKSALVGKPVTVRGYGFRPHLKGVVVFGAQRVASFRASSRGTFTVRFVVPAGRSRRLRVVGEQTVRDPGGLVRRLDRASASFRVVVNGFGGGLSVGGSGGLGGGPAGGLEAPPGGSPGGGGSAPATPAVKSSGSKEEPKEEPKEKAKEEPKEEPKEKAKEEPKEEPKEKAKEEPPAGNWWVPPKSLTWYWQLQGTVNYSEPVEAYDIDGFETTAVEVSTLHAKGIHVVCYIDVGTDEDWRPDASAFPASVIGKSNGWPGESYLNIADTSVLEPIMTKRFEMCKEKGFDAVEPDNMDTYEEGSKTGFTLTAAEQLTYDEWVAGEVHSLGMAVLQKNDGEQTKELEPYFDGALTEQCNQYSECSNFQPYLTAGKPVLNAEYELFTSSFCTADNTAGIMGARFSLELNGTTFEPCW